MAVIAAFCMFLHVFAAFDHLSFWVNLAGFADLAGLPFRNPVGGRQTPAWVTKVECQVQDFRGLFINRYCIWNKCHHGHLNMISSQTQAQISEINWII